MEFCDGADSPVDVEAGAASRSCLEFWEGAVAESVDPVAGVVSFLLDSIGTAPFEPAPGWAAGVVGEEAVSVAGVTTVFVAGGFALAAVSSMRPQPVMMSGKAINETASVTAQTVGEAFITLYSAPCVPKKAECVNLLRLNSFELIMEIQRARNRVQFAAAVANCDSESTYHFEAAASGGGSLISAQKSPSWRIASTNCANSTGFTT